MYRNILHSIIFIITLGMILLYLNLNHYVNFPSQKEQASQIIIKRGYSVKRIGKELKQYGYINSSKIFYLINRFIFRNKPLQAGEYEIPANATIREIINKMQKGEVIIHKFTIPEGVTKFEILSQIKINPMLVGEITKNFTEGELLADTYHYTYGESKMMLLNRIYKKSQKIITQLWETRQSDLPLSSINEALSLASIIEKETSLASERKRISGVFINRLRKKMRLQADPTVIYAVTKGEYLLNRQISRADLNIDSPYNTYLYFGLPPTAIASPGAASLEAALNPIKTEDLYFVVDGKGGHNFSSTLLQHNVHVNNYRKWQTQQ